MRRLLVIISVIALMLTNSLQIAFAVELPPPPIEYIDLKNITEYADDVLTEVIHIMAKQGIKLEAVTPTAKLVVDASKQNADELLKACGVFATASKTGVLATVKASLGGAATGLISVAGATTASFAAVGGVFTGSYVEYSQNPMNTYVSYWDSLRYSIQHMLNTSDVKLLSYFATMFDEATYTNLQNGAKFTYDQGLTASIVEAQVSEFVPSTKWDTNIMPTEPYGINIFNDEVYTNSRYMTPDFVTPISTLVNMAKSYLGEKSPANFADDTRKTFFKVNTEYNFDYECCTTVSNNTDTVVMYVAKEGENPIMLVDLKTGYWNIVNHVDGYDYSNYSVSSGLEYSGAPSLSNYARAVYRQAISTSHPHNMTESHYVYSSGNTGTNLPYNRVSKRMSDNEVMTNLVGAEYSLPNSIVVGLPVYYVDANGQLQPYVFNIIESLVGVNDGIAEIPNPDKDAYLDILDENTEDAKNVANDLLKDKETGETLSQDEQNKQPTEVGKPSTSPGEGGTNPPSIDPTLDVSKYVPIFPDFTDIANYFKSDAITGPVLAVVAFIGGFVSAMPTELITFVAMCIAFIIGVYLVSKYKD